jgi:hypothetical protein
MDSAFARGGETENAMCITTESNEKYNWGGGGDIPGKSAFFGVDGGALYQTIEGKREALLVRETASVLGGGVAKGEC